MGRAVEKVQADNESAVARSGRPEIKASPAPKDEGRGPASGQKLLRRLAGRLQAALKAPGVQRKAAAEAAPVKPRRDPRGNRYEAPEKPDQALPAEDADA